MVAFNPYLNFPGTTEKAFNFYKSVFGGEFMMIMRFSDTPESEKMPEDVKSKIMHISLPLSTGNVLMGTDVLAGMGPKLVAGNNFYLSVHASSREEADTFFNQLSDGGKIEAPMADMFWGDYFGSLQDKFDIKWIVTYHKSPDNDNQH